MEEKKVPALRFRGFDNAWEQKELGELFSYLQNNTLSRAELNDNYGVAQSIHYGDVLIKYGECLDVSKERLAFIEKQSIADKFKTAYLQDGDIIVADTAEDGTVGKCTEIQDLTDKKIISGLHTIPLRPDQKFASGYLGFYMNSNSYHDQLKPLMQGIKVTSISKSAIQNTVVRYPFSLKEQGLVSRYLCLLNTLISLHQRKLEMLKKVKKSMLEKMFPKNDAKVPELRFSDFTDAWEQHKLGELSEKTYGGGTPSTANAEYWCGNIPWLQSSDIIDGKLFDVTPKKYISQVGLNSSAAQLIPENSIAIITRVGVGKLAFLSFFYTTSQDFLSMSRLTTEPYFTVYACYKKLQSELNSVQGTSIKGITKDELLAKEIKVPSYDEQKQIGEYFTNLDHLISLHQRKLEKLKNIKKSMLEKMFI